MSKMPFNYALMAALFSRLSGPDKRFMQRSSAYQKQSKNRSPNYAGERHPGYTGRMRLFGRTVYLNKLKERRVR